MASDSTAAQLLDRVQTMAQVEAFEPRTYAERVAEELGEATTRDALAERDEQLRGALAHIEGLATRVMRIRVDHALAADTSIGPPTRKVFAATVASYAGRLDVLEARVRDIASKSGARDASAVASSIVEAATEALALRSALRDEVFALIARVAGAAVADADRQARDRRSEEPARRAWSAVRRELEAIAAQPERVTEAPFAIRIAGWPAQLDEPDPQAEPTRESLIELD